MTKPPPSNHSSKAVKLLRRFGCPISRLFCEKWGLCLAVHHRPDCAVSNGTKEGAVHKAEVFLLLLVVAPLTLSCGSGSGRQLQSITVTQTANGQPIEFVATGHFFAAPATVTPLPVTWSVGPFAPLPPRNLDYQLTVEPFLFDCTGSGPSLPVIAFAPSDPNVPSSGSWPLRR